MGKVGMDGMDDGRKFIIGYIEFPAGLFDDLADFRIMHMADPGKEVMFDLVIQTAPKPAMPFLFGGKIGGGVDLMDGPVVFNDKRFSLGLDKCCFFMHMGQLEDDRDQNACNKYQHAITQQGFKQPDLPDREDEESDGIGELGQPKSEMFP